MHKKVLLADADITLIKILGISIKGKGFDIETANDGEMALDQLKKGHFDLIILDLMMPKKNGFEVLEALKAAHNKTPTVVLSNLSQEEDISEAMALGVKKYFIKTDTSISEVVNFSERLLTA